MIPADKEKLLIIDFEATCSKDDTVPSSEMEIIEIGAVNVDRDLQPVAEFNSFVRPVIHTKLTDFCTELTTITQDQVDQAPSFEEVIDQFRKEMIDDKDTILFGSWGYYDKKQLLQDCKYHNVSYPFDDSHLNIKKWVAEKLHFSRPKGLGGALSSLDMEFEGTPHRGIDDVRNILRILQKINQ